LMPQILERLEKEPPLFVLHLGDLSHGLAYECEAIRASFDRIGVPIFVSPGNHDVFPWHSLQSFHRYLNVAPFAFTVAGQRFFVLDVADYPIAPAQLDWLEEGIRSAGESRSWVFLHRSPKDPLGLGREFPPKDGAARLESIVSMARDARTYAAHLGGYGKGTFGGHPFVMTSGGGERHKKENDAGPYHHLSVSLDGREGEVVTYDEPSFAGRILSRVQIEGPVFFSRPLLGLGGAALAALLLRLLSPRMSRRRLGSGTEAAPARETAPAPVLEPREARAS
ncbi:metallophosphoesterase, partial [bacterium]|nr:metallophosphoesterase [bacterium]